MKNVDVIDYYAVLGVPRNATTDQIESQWRDIQARYHPDHYRGLPENLAMVANHKLREIDAAADVLLDIARRAEFDESLRKAEQRKAAARPAPPIEQQRRTPTPAPVVEAKPAGPRPSGSSGSASVAAPRKGSQSSDRSKAGGSRKAAGLVLGTIAIVLIVAFATTKRSSKELVTPSPSAKPTSPTSQSPPTPKPPQTYTPAPKVQAPPPKVHAPPLQAPTPPPQVSTRGIPVEFLQAFQQYATKPGNKAIALALDNKGRWAHGSISGYSTQPEANEEALSECTRYKAKADVQENCRLFAIGDKVVW